MISNLTNKKRIRSKLLLSICFVSFGIDSALYNMGLSIIWYKLLVTFQQITGVLKNTTVIILLEQTTFGIPVIKVKPQRVKRAIQHLDFDVSYGYLLNVSYGYL